MSSTPERFKTTTDRNVGGWAYKDSEQMRFACACGNEGFGLASFDDYVDSMPDCPVKDDLLAWRETAFTACKAGNRLALRGWLQAAWVVWKSEMTFDSTRHTLEIGYKRSKQQSDNAKNRNFSLSHGDDRPEQNTTMAEIIEALADETDELGDYLKPKGLWPELYARLDGMHLNPNETNDPGSKDLKKTIIEYDWKNGRKTITGAHFANEISKHRKPKKSD